MCFYEFNNKNRNEKNLYIVYDYENWCKSKVKCRAALTKRKEKKTHTSTKKG